MQFAQEVHLIALLIEARVGGQLVYFSIINEASPL